MNKFLTGIFAVLLIFSLSGCFYTFKRHVSLDEVNKEMSTINYLDGINDLEAKYISQHYLLTTNEEPCKSLSKVYDVGTPYRKLVKNAKANTEHYYMGFLKYGWLAVYSNDHWLRLLVDAKTGKVTCIGEIRLQDEQIYTVR